MMKIATTEQKQLLDKKRNLSSYEVFLKFVKVVDGVEVGDEIMSKECYQLWLETRDKEIIHPEESFRRTLIAHVRGVYGRKCFAPSVEKSLLKLLRLPTTAGETFNSWDKCFDNQIRKIGKRGFNKLGFHEAKEAGVEADSNDTKRSPKKRKTKMKEVHSKKQSNPFPQLFPRASTFHENGEQKIVPKQEHFSPKSKSFRHLMDSPLYPNLGMLNFEINRRKHRQSMVEGEMLLPMVNQAFEDCRSPEDLRLLNQTAQDRGFQILSPAVMFFLENMETIKNDPRFDIDLLVPPPNERFFFPDRLVGQMMQNSRTWVIERCDEAAKAIWRCDVTNLHIFEVIESTVEFMCAFPIVFPQLEQHGECWMRSRVFLGDGTRAAFLLHLEMISETMCLVKIQDQSDIYGSLLERPFFI